MNPQDIERPLSHCFEDIEDARLDDAVQQALADLEALKATREECLESWYSYERSLLVLSATSSPGFDMKDKPH